MLELQNHTAQQNGKTHSDGAKTKPHAWASESYSPEKRENQKLTSAEKKTKPHAWASESHCYLTLLQTNKKMRIGAELIIGHMIHFGMGDFRV